ncbi:MAG: ShlB/FhaC/HecB family hemolysin secretion/activation protein [Deltaproteobacteria bacterium]
MTSKTCPLSVFLLFLGCACASAQSISTELRTRQLEEKERALRQEVQKEAAPVEIKQELPAPPAPQESQEKTLINTINVTGVTLLPEAAIEAITAGFKGRTLSLKDLQTCADLITDAYRKKGYITSRAYLPPQRIAEAAVEIRVVEGLMGDLTVTGNRYFSTALFERRFSLKKGDGFDYDTLRADLSRINQYPDREARAVLVPGKEPGTTDVTLEVTDRLPVHATLDWDNFGSRFIGKDRYEAAVSHNNLLGRDDSLTFQYQIAEADAYRLTSVRYLLPVTDTTEIGLFSAWSKLELGKQFRAVQARGKSRFYSIYATQDVLNTQRVNLNLRLGFDYKDYFNFSGGNETSRDRMRVVRTSYNLDVSDGTGRTILDQELDVGLAGVMGGLEEVDAHASRAGAGGKFVKTSISLLRLQAMPFSSTLLWKSQFQISPYILTAAEQFQLGGIANLRGYPPAELVGDDGTAMTFEWSFPVYGLSKTAKVPFTDTRWYDAIRVVAFYDWGYVRLHRPQAGEEAKETLRDAGCGMRFSLPGNLSVRVDVAWPLDRTPTDGDNVHPWFQVTKEF